MSEEIIVIKPTTPKPLRVFAYTCLAIFGAPMLLLIGLATAHFLSLNYNFVYHYGNRGLGMVVSASLGLLLLSIALSAKQEYTLRQETLATIEAATQSNLAVPALLSTPNRLIETFRQQPLALAAWLPAFVVGTFIYATMLANFSMQRLQSALNLANSGGADQLMIEALWTFAAVLTANVLIGLIWAKIWRKKILMRKTALLNLREQISQIALAAVDQPEPL